MRKPHNNISQIEHTELIHSAKKCVQILCFVEINASFPNVKNNIRARSSLKESVIFLEYFRHFIESAKFNISSQAQIFILSLLDEHLNGANKILQNASSNQEIIEKIAILFPFDKEKEMGSIMFYVLKKWCFNANYASDCTELITEKLAWADALRMTLQDILYKKQTDIYLYESELYTIFNLINLHCNNLKTLLLSEEERNKKIEIAKGFGKKVASSSAVVLSKNYKKKTTEKIEETV